jgi:hypothetical protein
MLRALPALKRHVVHAARLMQQRKARQPTLAMSEALRPRARSAHNRGGRSLRFAQRLERVGEGLLEFA